VSRDRDATSPATVRSGTSRVGLVRLSVRSYASVGGVAGARLRGVRTAHPPPQPVV
jgi:hypothetical protein